MKIGFFSAHRGPIGGGGAERYLLSLMLGVRKHGHEPLLFGVEGASTITQATAHGIPTVIWRKSEVGGQRTEVGGERSESRGREGDNDSRPTATDPPLTTHNSRRFLRALIPPWAKLFLGATREALVLARLFRRNRVEVMHVNNNVYEMAGMAGWLAGIPSICVHHFMPPDEPYWARRLLIKQSNRFYRHVIGVSNACITAWRSYAGCIRQDRSSFVWNGIDLESFTPPPTPRPRNPAIFQLISTGRLDPMKGFLDLIAAMAQLDDPSIQLWIVGDGQQRPELEDAIAKAGLTGICRLLGHRDDVVDLLRQADCFVFASSSRESFGLALAEAMATGLPAITTNFGPLPEINQDHETGLLVPVNQPSALAAAIRRLRNEPELRIQMGIAARQRAVQCFRVERMVAETVAVYEHAATDRRL